MLIEILAFLESKNWKYNLISYRMKAGSKQFKEVCISYEKDYVKYMLVCNITNTRDIASSLQLKKDLMDYY
nr:hypothetical protein [Mycoplasmopsis bovis]